MALVLLAILLTPPVNWLEGGLFVAGLLMGQWDWISYADRLAEIEELRRKRIGVQRKIQALLENLAPHK